MLVLDKVGGGVTLCEPSLVERLATRLRSTTLDRQLARGTRPEASVSLALRAQALVRPAARQRLAHGLQAVLAEATHRRRRMAAVPVRGGSVREAQPELEALVDRLSAPAPLPAAGVALVRLLLVDGSGPLYRRSSGLELRAWAHRALEEMDSLTLVID
jgi:hypothetical protein